MKKIFADIPRRKFIAAASAFIWMIAIATSARGAQLQEARVTQIVNDVKLLLEQGAPRPAAVSDLVRRGNAVRTGTQSRSELTFADLTITRLGANTIFSFKEGTREMNLIDGAILFQVPKGSGGATIRTVGVTAAITGTTGIGEFHPATTSRPQPFSKWLCLEGTFHLYLANGQSVELGPGKMVTSDGKSFSKVSTFDIAKLVSTSLFFTGFDQPLASMNLIMLESENQLASSLFATSTTNPLDPARIVNVTSQAFAAEETQTSPPASPTPPITPTPPVSPTPPPPTPSKFGTPSVISSPVPYLITSGTVIKTDPSITTNGVTNFGTIYRGPEDDGAFSLWAFGSTSAVDNALDFDTHFNNAGHFPGAAFKFTSLVLAGNPTIDLSNSGVTNLALISIGDITSALPGGTLTFTGLDALLLASQDGSINLGSEITFQDIPTLFFYARGTNGDLTLASPIVGTTDLFLYAGRNITFNAGTNLILGGQFSARSVGGNISVSESGNVSVGGSLSVTTDASNVQNGANIFVSSGGDMLIGGSFALFVFAGDDSTTGTGGNIDVHSGGSLTAGDLNFTSRFDPSLGVTEGANVSLNVAGNLTTMAGGITLRHSTPVGSPTATLADGGNLRLMVGGNLTAAPGAGLTLDIINTNGSSVLNGANIFASIGGDLTAESVTLRSSNNGNGSTGTGSNLTLEVGGGINASNFFAELNNSSGGHIGTGGNIAVSIGGDLMSLGDLINATIDNSDGGTIGGSANINFNLAGDLTTLGDANFTINNSNGGTIGSEAAINVSANNISAGSLETAISNEGGSIGGNASIDFSAAAGITTQGDALFVINNSIGSGGSGGTIATDATLTLSANDISIGGSLSAVINNAIPSGNGFIGVTIGGDATIDVTANNITANSLLAQIDNTGGSIGANTEGGAMINMNVSNSATVTNDATVAIYGSDGAVGGAGININGGNYNVGGTFLSYIDGNGTITFNNASAHADVLKAGVFGANGVLNIGGGTLSADTTLKLYAPGSNGQLNFISNVTLGGNSVKILAANSITIFNNVVVTIGGSKPADVYTGFTNEIPNANYTGFGGNKSTTGTFAGAGANDPQPLSKAPPFGTVSRATVRTGGNITTDGNGTRGKKVDSVIHVSSSDELLSLLDGAAPGPGGKITIPRSKSTSNSRNSNRTDVADRLKAGSRVNADRRAMDMRTASSSVIRRSPQ